MAYRVGRGAGDLVISKDVSCSSDLILVRSDLIERTPGAYVSHTERRPLPPGRHTVPTSVQGRSLFVPSLIRQHHRYTPNSRILTYSHMLSLARASLKRLFRPGKDGKGKAKVPHPFPVPVHGGGPLGPLAGCAARGCHLACSLVSVIQPARLIFP